MWVLVIYTVPHPHIYFDTDCVQCVTTSFIPTLFSFALPLFWVLRFFFPKEHFIVPSLLYAIKLLNKDPPSNTSKLFLTNPILKFNR